MTKKTRGSTVGVPRGVKPSSSGFPNQLQITHKYHAEKVLTSTTAVSGANYFQFVVNGIFDPEPGVGHQPAYFDTMTPLYDSYVVNSSYIVVEFCPVNPVTGATPIGTVGIMIDSDGSFSNNVLNTAVENPSSVSRSTAIGNGFVKLTKSWSAKQAFGTRGLGDPSIIGSTTANPADVQSFVVFARNSDTAAPTANYVASVTVWYHTTWFQVKDHVGS